MGIITASGHLCWSSAGEACSTTGDRGEVSFIFIFLLLFMGTQPTRGTTYLSGALPTWGSTYKGPYLQGAPPIWGLTYLPGTLPSYLPSWGLT